MRSLQEDLQNALQQTDELEARNRELEAKLLMAGTGKRQYLQSKRLRSVWWSVTILRNG